MFLPCCFDLNKEEVLDVRDCCNFGFHNVIVKKSTLKSLAEFLEKDSGNI